MRLTHFFIDRPIFATVLSVFVTLVGLGALAILPVAQYPEIVPPTVQITTVYPGATSPRRPPVDHIHRASHGPRKGLSK